MNNYDDDLGKFLIVTHVRRIQGFLLARKVFFVLFVYLRNNQFLDTCQSVDIFVVLIYADIRTLIS